MVQNQPIKNSKPFFNPLSYGQDTPPDYDLSLITETVRLWHGSGDKLADDTDVGFLEKRLVNAKVSSTHLDKWGHLTFNVGKVCTDTYENLASILLAEYKVELE